ncbi:MAG: YfiT family bacillithiol transferase [Acidobacteriota bacterium]
MADLRYPIGRFNFTVPPTADQRRILIDQIAETPGLLKAAVKGLTESQLAAPYRPEGWTVRQVVHHVADSHMNSYVRFKLALTEEQPTIKTYFEDRWAELPEARTAPVEISLALLDSLHARWVMMLQAMTEADFNRSLHHPELGIVTLEKNLALYAWHGRHHVAHITSLRERLGWR